MAITVVLTHGGCALMIGSYAEYTPLNSGACGLARAPGAAVEILTSVPAAPHIETGLIEVSAVGRGQAGTSTALDLIRREAAARGCHAARLGDISVKRGDHYHETGQPVIDLIGLLATDPKDRKLVSATCIVLRDPVCLAELARPAPAPPPVAAAASRPPPRRPPQPAVRPGPPLGCRPGPAWPPRRLWPAAGTVEIP
jgi:hypothetical protein